ncbi:hypothetical protein [Saccharopolyspora gregorii]|uniref:hypothetical protein n=1 Tax=Saccharopolyspora gregorii TaxID=33914 RepID=UPI0021AC1B8F|nr:hypothetical protein [Saccharopolyspora gregorii]
MYVLTASLIDQAEAEPIRAALTRLRKGGRKLHWSKEPDRRRDEIAKVTSTFASTNLVVVGSASPMNAERARRKCLEALLPEVEAAGASVLTLESRRPRNDKLDQQTVAVCKRKRAISMKVHVEFTAGDAEPMLWLPDIVCGSALAAARGNRRYLEQLADAARLLEVDAS